MHNSDWRTATACVRPSRYSDDDGIRRCRVNRAATATRPEVGGGRRSKDTDSATGSQSVSQSVASRRVKLHAANLKANATNADLVVVTVAPAAHCVTVAWHRYIRRCGNITAVTPKRPKICRSTSSSSSSPFLFLRDFSGTIEDTDISLINRPLEPLRPAGVPFGGYKTETKDLGGIFLPQNRFLAVVACS